jgi:hypothetical protein
MVHLAWILWVPLGALLTRHRPLLGGFHVISLIYGAVIEVGPWSYPLTLAEQWLRVRQELAPIRKLSSCIILAPSSIRTFRKNS